MYYVDPFVFVIIKLIEFNQIQDETGIYIVDSDGAYLEDIHVFDKLEDAKSHALKLLGEFFESKTNQILDTRENNDN